MAQTILIVDDSKTIRHILSSMLQNNGYKVTEAVDGVDALVKLETFPSECDVDLIVTDINMPNMGGMELIKKIKADPKYESIPIVTLTTESKTDIKEQGKEAGAIAWITKPLNPENVRIVIKMVLKQYGTKKS